MIDSEIKTLLQAANHRLEAALHLKAAEAFGLESVYLAGYTVELDFKALILFLTKPVDRTARFNNFKRKEGHNLEDLLQSISKLGVDVPAAMRQAQVHVTTHWSTELRYEAGLVPSVDIEEFFEAVLKIHALVEELIDE